MTSVAVALNKFFGGFGIPAYVEEHVPDNAKLPYITYTLAAPDWLSPASIPARIWYYGDSFEGINAKIDEVSKAIGQGLSIGTPTGCVYLFKDNPFVQMQPFDNTDYRVAYLNIGMYAFTE